MTAEQQRCQDVAFIDGSKECRSTAGEGPFHTYFSVWVILIVEEPTVTDKYRTNSNKSVVPLL